MPSVVSVAHRMMMTAAGRATFVERQLKAVDEGAFSARAVFGLQAAAFPTPSLIPATLVDSRHPGEVTPAAVEQVVQ